MRRRTFISGLAGILLFPPLAQASLLDLFSSPESRQRAELERIVHRDYGSGEDVSRRNNQALIDYFVERKGVWEFVRNPKKLARKLGEDLQRLEHARYKSNKPPPFVEYLASNNLEELTPRQLLRLFFFMDVLEDRSTINDLGKKIEDDILDRYAEHGGIILPREQTPFYRVDSTYPGSGKNKGELKNILRGVLIGNHRYRISPPSLQIPHLAEYHFHAATNNGSEVAGPSLIQREDFIDGDIGYILEKIENNGEGHGVVITKLKRERFNVGYFGGELDKQGHPKIKIVSLGNYGY